MTRWLTNPLGIALIVVMTACAGWAQDTSQAPPAEQQPAPQYPPSGQYPYPQTQARPGTNIRDRGNIRLHKTNIRLSRKISIRNRSVASVSPIPTGGSTAAVSASNAVEPSTIGSVRWACCPLS